MKVTRVMELEEIISSTRDELESLRAKATAPSKSKLDGQPHAKATATNNLNGRAGKQIDTPVDLVKPKSEAVAQLGLTQKQAEHYQLMSKNPDAVHAAMAKAREGDGVTCRSVVGENRRHGATASRLARRIRNRTT